MLQTTHQSLLQKLGTIVLLETMLEYASVTIQQKISLAYTPAFIHLMGKELPHM